MYAKFAPLALSLLFANAVVAAAASSSPLNILAARATGGIDTSGIPSECKSACEGPVSTLDKCQTAASKDPACVCNGEFSGALVSCFNCVIRTDKKQDTVDVAQKEYDTVKEGCKAIGAGEKIPDHTFTINGDNGAARLAGPALFGVGAAVLAGLL